MNARKILAAMFFLGLALFVGANEASAQSRSTQPTKTGFAYQFNKPNPINTQYQRPLGSPVTLPTLPSVTQNYYQNLAGQTVRGMYSPGYGWQQMSPVRR